MPFSQEPFSPEISKPDLVLTKLRRAGFLILAILFIVAAGIAIRGRAPWYDEFYTFYLVRPNVPVDLLWPAWLRDNHPPLFYALVWAWSRFLGGMGQTHALTSTVEGLRTVNLVIFAGFAAMLAWIMRVLPNYKRPHFSRLNFARPDLVRIIWYDCLVLAATVPALDQIDQLRSYFLSFALTALLLIVLLQRFAGHSGWRAGIALGVILALACSVHLVTTVIAGALFTAAIGQRLLAKSWRDACVLILIGAVAIIPFGVMMAVQLPAILANTQKFWIPSGFNAGRWALETEIFKALFANPVMTLLALAGLITLAARIGQSDIRGHIRGDTRGDIGARRTMLFMATLAGGLVLAMVVLMVAHLSRPLLITRYLVALDPAVALIVALGAAAATQRLPVRQVAMLEGLALVAAGWVLYANCSATLARPGWDGTGGAIARIVHTCPQTVVHPDMRWNTMPLDMPPRDNRDVVPFAYAFVAHRFGYALAPAGSRTVSLSCPTVFWTEHVADQHPTAQTVLNGLRVSGYVIRSGQIRRIGDGWIFVSPAMASGAD